MKRNGFTIPELLVVMGIMLVLWAIATISLVRTQTTNSLDVTADLLVSDIKSQQTKAMASERDSSFGIFFEGASYTLFTGEVYIAGDPGNFTVEVLSPTSLSSINLNLSSVVFSKGSGEVSAIFSGSGFSLVDAVSGEEIIFGVNKYGTLTRN